MRLLCDLFPYFLGRHWRDPKITQVSFDSFAVGGLVLAIALYGIWRGRGSDRWFLLAVVIFGVAARMALAFFAALTRPIPGLNIAINQRLQRQGPLAFSSGGNDCFSNFHAWGRFRLRAEPLKLCCHRQFLLTPKPAWRAG